MSLLVNDADIARVQAATSQVIKDTIGQIATVLVPAIAASVTGQVTVTIDIPPIVIKVSI